MTNMMASCVSNIFEKFPSDQKISRWIGHLNLLPRIAQKRPEIELACRHSATHTVELQTASFELMFVLKAKDSLHAKHEFE